MKQKDEFIKALEENNSDAIKVLLQTDFDPGFDDNFAICLAAEKGFKEIVALLINDTRVDPIVSYAKPLWLAAQNGHTPVVELFLFNNFNPRIYTRHHGIGFDKNNWSQRPFLWAVENGFTEIVQLFIERDLGQEDGFSPYPSSYSSLDKKNIFQEAYYLAIKSQKVAIVELLLDDDRVSPDEQEQQYNYITPLVLAVQTRNQELIKLLLDEDRIDSSKDSNAAFNKACELGYDDIVEFLLSNKVKPYYQKPEVSNSNDACHKMTWRGLYLAISNKHGDVAKRLLQHPEAPLQAAFLWAAEEGFDSLLEFILKTKGDEINPLYSKSLCLRQAATNGHHAVVALLLDDNRALPQVLGNQAMRTAAENGHIEVVKLLLSDERVNPGARENKALRMAASKGHDKIVDLLLKCPKIDLNKRGYEAAENAIYTNFWPVLELFIKDARLNLDGLVSKARSQDNYNIIFLLFRHLPWSFDTLLLKLNKGSPIYQNDERRFIASKLLNTCGLFQLAEPALPQDVNKVIAQYMIKVSNEGESQSLTQTHPKSG